MFKKIKKALAMVDGFRKAFGALAWLGGLIIPNFVVRSSSLRLWMITGALLGGAIGYYATTVRWGGKGKQAALKASVLHGKLAAIALVTLVFLLAVLKPDFAVLSWAFIQIREVLLRSDFFPNLLGFVLTGATIWLAVGTITLLSPRLWDTPP